MYESRNFFFRNQRMLIPALLAASLSSCMKEKISPTPQVEQPEEVYSAANLSGTNGHLLFHENADGAGFMDLYVKRHTATSYALTASTAQFFNGTKSARFELRDTDPEVQSGTRAEITFPDATNMNRWYAFAMYVPAAQYKYDKDDEVISQWHQGGGATPALCLRTKADHLFLRIMGNIWIDLGLLDKDKWHTYVMHVKHSGGSDGLIELWRDDQKIVNRTGQNMYALSSTYHAPNWKMGIYKSDWNGSGTTATNLRVLYFDDIKLGNELATYSEMVPTRGATTPPPTDPPPPVDTTQPDPTPPPPTSTLSVTSFTLVNSATEKDVITIANGQVISLSALKLEKANIRANTSTATVGSVKLELSGKQTKSYVDNAAPFALHGDDSKGNYYYGNWNPPALGMYTLKATPYTKGSASGTVGTSKTITFTIVQ